jgi:hypothetical protein
MASMKLVLMAQGNKILKLSVRVKYDRVKYDFGEGENIRKTRKKTKVLKERY